MPKGIPAAKELLLQLKKTEQNVLVTKGAKTFPGTDIPIPKGIAIRSANGVQIEFMYENERCYETLRGKPTIGSVKAAVEKRERVLQLIGLGSFDYKKEFPLSNAVNKTEKSKTATTKEEIITLRTALDAWLEITLPSVGHNAGIDYKKDIARLKLFPASALASSETEKNLTNLGTLGDVAITELNDLSINNLQSWLRDQDGQNTGKKLSIKRVNNLMTPMRGAMARMADEKKISYDPFTKIRPLKIQKSISEDKLANTTELDSPLPIVGNRHFKESNIIVEPFSPNEVSAILKQLSGSFLNQMVFWLWTGLRTGELIALRWSDVHWESGQIFVRRSLSRGHLKLPKFDKKRWVKLCDPARAALEAQLKLTGLGDGWIFPNPFTKNRWTSESKIRSRFKAALEKAGVRYRRPYNCRHTYASVMLSSGENTLYVAEQMGHADWTMLIKVYGRWINGVDLTAGQQVAKMNDSLWKSLDELLTSSQIVEDGNKLSDEVDFVDDVEPDEDPFEM